MHKKSAVPKLLGFRAFAFRAGAWNKSYLQVVMIPKGVNPSLVAF
jgi:hypothetical protein